MRTAFNRLCRQYQTLVFDLPGRFVRGTTELIFMQTACLVLSSCDMCGVFHGWHKCVHRRHCSEPGIDAAGVRLTELSSGSLASSGWRKNSWPWSVGKRWQRSAARTDRLLGRVHLKMTQMKGWRLMMVCSRSGPVEMISIGASTIASIRAR